MKNLFLKIVSLVCFWILSFTVFADASDDLTRLLNGLNSMSADFDQVSLSKKSQAVQHITGQMALQKPGKFRWQQMQPSKQLIIANGSYVWIYDADLEQVTKQKIDYKQPGNPAMLLTGSIATLRNTFAVKSIEGEGQGDWFELRPKASNNLYQWIRLHFVNNKLADMQMADNLGQNNTFHFKNVVVNPVLSTGKFIFIAPKGVDVIEE